MVLVISWTGHHGHTFTIYYEERIDIPVEGDAYSRVGWDKYLGTEWLDTTALCSIWNLLVSLKIGNDLSHILTHIANLD